MARMIKMEAVVFARYFKQLAFTMAFTMACVAIGMGTISAIPSIAFVMMMFSASVSGSAYDEQNDWGAYRLVLPVSRRDVVLGRYAFNLLAALTASALAALLVGIFVLAGRLLPLTGFAADLLAWNEEVSMAAVAGMVSCACIALAMSSVTLPAYFKLGQTKATQWLPFIMLLLSVAPFVAIGFIGGEALEMLESAMEASRATGGFGPVGLGALAVALAAYALSACVSVRLYEGRDL